MLRIEWLAADVVIHADVLLVGDLKIAAGKALGRAIYLARKQEATPTSYRVFDADGNQVSAGIFPLDLLAAKRAGEP